MSVVNSAFPLLCSRHQTLWNSAHAALCPVCTDDPLGPAHHNMTDQERLDSSAPQQDTPRCNYAASCGTSAFAAEARKLERELADARAERDALLMALRGQKIALSLMLDRYSDGEICRMPVNYLRTQAECIDAAIDARKP